MIVAHIDLCYDLSHSTIVDRAPPCDGPPKENQQQTLGKGIYSGHPSPTLLVSRHVTLRPADFMAFITTAGCSLSGNRGNTAFVGFYQPILFSPLQVANFARCVNSGDIHYDRATILRVAAVSSTVLGAGLGFGALYTGLMKDIQAFRSPSRRDKSIFLYNSTTPLPGLAGIWIGSDIPSRSLFFHLLTLTSRLPSWICLAEGGLLC